MMKNGKKIMSDAEIISAILNYDNLDDIVMSDDNNDVFEMMQLGVVPMHDMTYAVLDLLKINGEEVSEEDQGLVILELDIDEETGERVVTTVEDEDLFNEIIAAYEDIPDEQ
jgi:hypothetical protein